MDIEKFTEELESVDWPRYRTAYGAADGVGRELLELACGSRERALKASHSLWCGLCHQHAYLSSAAEPAYPFLLQVLVHCDATLKAEILEIFLGFAECSSPAHSDGDGSFLQRVRALLQRDKAVFREVLERCDDSEGDARDFAGMILEELES